MNTAEPSGIPTLTIEGRVATIRLNRPEVHNRVEPDDLRALHGLLDQIEADAALRVIVLTAGGKSFSSGFHIGKIGAATDGDEDSFATFADRLERVRLPTICALNGGVYGGSTDLALACDFRLGVTGAVMFMPAARLGVHYYPGGLQRYVSRLGVNNAKRLFLTAEKLNAEEMLRIGFLTELLPPDRLEARTQELATTLAEGAPLAVQGMKSALNAIARGDADLAAIEAASRASKHSADIKEGRAAWLGKRPPRFEGR
ncbi:MAG TPA: enoyl-CoA hydratase/isomerase family protein [Roseomonas sp.]|jgi:enoyl-CoA hydratase/carnithine racemase